MRLLISSGFADATGRIASALERCGFGDDDALARDHPLLAELYAAAVEGRNATGADAGRRVARIGRPVVAPDGEESRFPLCAVVGGSSLHAGVYVPATDRRALQRVCRYVGRPAVAAERLEQLPDGRLLYRLRHCWRDGTSVIVLEPREFVARLAAQIPPPNAHQVRYHGVLGPAAAWRRYVVPSGDADGEERKCRHAGSSVPQSKRMAWSDLLRRVFTIDALVCDRCGARMRVMAAIRAPADVSRFLAGVSGAGRAPPSAFASDSSA